ncbi:MAG TPA: hypothetical protein VE465_07595, partial [Streptosporangiaceae bacterium]|nr:hypothetical protein [Streptosporangiaceae bacterium]
MRPLIRRLICLAVGATLAFGVVGAGPANSDQVSGDLPVSGERRVPGDQPLPGFTINNPPLTPATVNGVPTRVLQGVHEHAAYDIEVPPRWNGELVMWAHGFRGNGTVLTVDPPGFGLRQRLLDQGYAWAASSYYANGYDVRAGVLSTKDLALLFRRLVRPPRRTMIVGVSMGGHIVGRSIEQFPGLYAGALPMCGVLGDDTLFDFFLDYNVVAQGIAGIRAFPPPADYLTNAVPRIQQAIGFDTLRPGGPDTTNDLGKQFRAIVINRSGGPRPGAEQAVAVWKDFLFGLGAQATGSDLAQNPGLVATNVGRRYEPNFPVDVNGTVQRVPLADPKARFTKRLIETPQIFGRPSVPVLSLHDLGDLFVPFSMEQIYRADVARHGRAGLVVQRAIRAAQHCEFSTVEAGQAWDDLTAWVRRGVKPAGDDVTRPGAAEFGCRFSDPAAFAAGVG